MNARRVSRVLALGGAVAALGFIAACDGEEKEGKKQEVRDNRAQVTEADVIQCGRNATLLDNRTANAYNVHVRVKHECGPVLPDTIIHRATDAHLMVLDSQGKVLNGVDIAIPPQSPPWRGVVTVPAGAHLQLNCGSHVPLAPDRGCTWSYSYSP